MFENLKAVNAVSLFGPDDLAKDRQLFDIFTSEGQLTPAQLNKLSNLAVQRKTELLRQIRLLEQFISGNQAKIAALKRANRKSDEQQAAETAARLHQLRETIAAGDFVRVVGVRNTRLNWRKIVEVNTNTITGWQASRDRHGVFTLYGQVTTNQLDKIREVVKNLDAVTTAPRQRR